jgi:hypothetical protein
MHDYYADYVRAILCMTYLMRKLLKQAFREINSKSSEHNKHPPM